MVDEAMLFKANKKLQTEIADKTKKVEIEKPVKIEVVNQQKVDGTSQAGGINLRFENDAVEVKNLEEINTEIANLKEALLAGLKNLNTSTNVNVDTTGIIKAIKDIPEVSLPEQIDYSKDIVKELKTLSKMLGKKGEKKDDKVLMDKLMDIEETIENEFSYRSFKDRLKVQLPEKQLKLIGSSISVSTGGLNALAATNAKQDEMIAAINNISGLQRSTDLDGGGIVSIGTTAVELTFTGTTESIIITAAVDNTGVIYIGKSDVTSAGANAVAVLLAGQSATIDYDDSTNALYAVSDTTSQSIIKGALL